MKQLISRWSSIYVTKPSFTGTRRILCSLFLKLFCRWQHVKVRAHIRLRDHFRPVCPTSLCTITRGDTNYRIWTKKNVALFLSSSFSLCQGWGAVHNFFTASSDSLFNPPLYLVFFLQSSSSLAFLTSLLTQSSHLSLGLPRLLLPCSRNSAALFGSLSSHILSTCPAHCSLLLTSLSVKLLCTPVSSLNSTIIHLYVCPHYSCYFFTQLFSHTCNLCCCSSVIARVSVSYRHAGVSQVLTTLPLSLCEIRRSAITPSTALHAFAPACAIRRTSISVFPSPHTVPPMYTKLFRWESASFFPFSSMSSSSLWWPMCSTSVFPRFIFSPCQGNSPFYSSSVSCGSCLPFATRARSSA